MKTQITRWNPFQEMEQLQNRLAQLWNEEPFRFANGQKEAVTMADWTPKVDIVEDDKEFLIKAELPDMKREDVKVVVEDNVLTVSGERRQEKEEKGKRFHRVECDYGSFTRSFTLPPSTMGDKVTAEFKDGALRSTCRRTPSRPPARTWKSKSPETPNEARPTSSSARAPFSGLAPRNHLKRPPMKTSRGKSAHVAPPSASSHRTAAGEWNWHYRTLVALRDHLLGCSGDREREPIQAMEPPSLHAEDFAADVYDRKLAAALPTNLAVALREVQDALARIKDGTYGRCENTGRRIPAALLQARPWRRSRDA